MRINLICATAALAGLFGSAVRAEPPAAAPGQPAPSASSESPAAQPAPGALSQQDQDVCSYAMDLDPPTAAERCKPGAWDALKAGEPGKIRPRGALVKNIYSALQEQAADFSSVQDDSIRTDSAKLRSGMTEATKKKHPYYSDASVGIEISSLTPDDVSERTFPAWIRGEDPQKLAQAYRLWLLLKNEQLRIEKYAQKSATPEEKQKAQERRQAIDAQLVANKMVLERLKNPSEFARTVDNARQISGSVDVGAQGAVSASWRAEQESKPATLAMKLKHPIDNSVVPRLAAWETKSGDSKPGAWGTAKGWAGAAGLGLLGTGGLLLASSKRKEAEDRAEAERKARAEVAAEDAANGPIASNAGGADAITQQQAQSDIAAGARTWVNGAVMTVGTVVLLAGVLTFSAPAAAIGAVVGGGIITYGYFRRF